MKLVFMGSPDFAVPALRALAARHEVLCVYTQPPRPAGRGKAARKTAVHQAAEALGLPVRHPPSLKRDAAQAEFAALDADVAVVAAYGLILPQAVLDAPRHGCINIHASLLPRWRGAAPIHRAIMAGDAETGVTIMQMEMRLDAGPVRLKRAVKIGAEETTGALHDRLADLGAEAVVEVLGDLRRPSAGAAERSGHDLCREDRQGRGADGLDPPRGRGRSADPRAFARSPAPGAWLGKSGSSSSAAVSPRARVRPERCCAV